MKRIFITLSFAFIIATTNAQITMGLKLGGHLPTSRTALPGFVQIESDGTQKVLIGTMGSGLDLSGLIAFDLTKNLALGFDVGYFHGFNIKFHQYATINGTDNQLRKNVATNGIFFNVSPYLMLKPSYRNNQPVVPYCRVGLHSGLATVTSTTTVSGFQGKSVDKYSGNWSLGLLSAIGVSISINKNASLFSELTIKTIAFRPKELRNIENFDGQDAGKVTRFVKEVDPNGPTNNELSFLIPFNSLGVSFGYQYRLGK
jgi:opacity protein-like surface antigen